MPSSTSRSDTRGRPVRPCTAGGCRGINGSNSAHSSSLISRGGEDPDDMRDTLRRPGDARQGPNYLFLQRLLNLATQGRRPGRQAPPPGPLLAGDEDLVGPLAGGTVVQPQ